MAITVEGPNLLGGELLQLEHPSVHLEILPHPRVGGASCHQAPFFFEIAGWCPSASNCQRGLILSVNPWWIDLVAMFL